MKIIDREDGNKMDYRQIVRGQVFRHGECIYMNIGNILTLDDDDCEEEYSAVCLNDGSLASFYDDDKVEPLYEAELILYPRK